MFKFVSRSRISVNLPSLVYTFERGKSPASRHKFEYVFKIREAIGVVLINDLKKNKRKTGGIMKKIISVLLFVWVAFAGLFMGISSVSAEMIELTPIQMRNANVAFGLYDYVMEDSRDPFEYQKKKRVAEVQWASNEVMWMEEDPGSVYVRPIKIEEGSDLANLFEAGSTVIEHHTEMAVNVSRQTWTTPDGGSASSGPSWMTYNTTFYIQAH